MKPVLTVPYQCPTCGTEQFIKLGDGQMEADRYCLKCSEEIDVAAVRAAHGRETVPQAPAEVPEHVRAGH